MRLFPFSFRGGFWKKPTPLTPADTIRYGAMLSELKDIRDRLQQLKEKGQSDFHAGADVAISELLYLDSWVLAVTADRTIALIERELTRGAKPD